MARKRERKVYGYGDANRLPLPAQAVGEELERIERRLGLTPKAVVDESRPEDALLHPVFEWDDEVAAEQYRQVQAGRIIRSVRVVSVDPETEGKTRTPAFVSVHVAESNQREYVSTARAMSDAERRAEVLADAMAQLNGLRRRYDHLAELAGVWEALDAAAGAVA